MLLPHHSGKFSKSLKTTGWKYEARERANNWFGRLDVSFLLLYQQCAVKVKMVPTYREKYNAV